MRKVLYEEWLKSRWKCRNECQEMPQEVVYAIVDYALGEGCRGGLRETSFESLQTGFCYKFSRTDNNPTLSQQQALFFCCR